MEGIRRCLIGHPAMACAPSRETLPSPVGNIDHSSTPPNALQYHPPLCCRAFVFSYTPLFFPYKGFKRNKVLFSELPCLAPSPSLTGPHQSHTLTPFWRKERGRWGGNRDGKPGILEIMGKEKKMNKNQKAQRDWPCLNYVLCPFQKNGGKLVFPLISQIQQTHSLRTLQQ